MKDINITSNFIKFFIINIFVYFTYIKVSNYKNSNKKNIIIIGIANMVITSIFIALVRYTNKLFAILIMCLLLGITMQKILKQKFNYSILVTIISFILTYLIHLISVLISGMILMVLAPNISYQNPISGIIIPFIMIIIYFFISKIKRLKNGFNFLNNIEKVEKTGKFLVVILLTTIAIVALLQDSKENIILNTMLTIGIILTFACATIWVKHQITKKYKSNMRDRTVEMQKTEIDEQTKVVDELKEENLKLATTVHKYNSRLSALEMAMENVIKENANTEFANEISVILEDTKELSKNFAKESTIIKQKLPLTNIIGIDNMFEYMQKEALENNIKFDLKINESINELINNIIPKDKFETLLGDHLKDAIIAVKFSDNSYKSILVTLGIVENCYELSIYDTGIEFEIDTLLKLGEEQITTHKETGGSGIGFMTTFETLKETKASLIIEEYNPDTTNYTKSVNIRFDNKNEYKIYSYRADKIKENSNKTKRIIIKNIE